MGKPIQVKFIFPVPGKPLKYINLAEITVKKMRKKSIKLPICGNEYKFMIVSKLIGGKTNSKAQITLHYENPAKIAELVSRMECDDDWEKIPN